MADTIAFADSLGKEPPPQILDRLALSCNQCSSEFTLFKKKYHCGACGRIVCWECVQGTYPLAYANDQPVRVCIRCLGLLKQREHRQSDLAIESTLHAKQSLEFEGRWLYILQQGEQFVRYGRKGVATPVHLYLRINAPAAICWRDPLSKSFVTDEDEKARVVVTTIDFVRRGKHTETFLRGDAKRVADECCFSLVGADFTHDFSADTKEVRDRWLSGLRAAVDVKYEGVGVASQRIVKFTATKYTAAPEVPISPGEAIRKAITQMSATRGMSAPVEDDGLGTEEFAELAARLKEFAEKGVAVPNPKKLTRNRSSPTSVSRHSVRLSPRHSPTMQHHGLHRGDSARGSRRSSRSHSSRHSMQPLPSQPPPPPPSKSAPGRSSHRKDNDEGSGSGGLVGSALGSAAHAAGKVLHLSKRRSKHRDSVQYDAKGKRKEK